MFMKPCASVQQAVDAALEKQGPGAQVLFLMQASITVPRIKGSVGAGLTDRKRRSQGPVEIASKMGFASLNLVRPLSIMLVRLCTGFFVWEGAREANGGRL